MKGFFFGGGDVIEQIYLTKAGVKLFRCPPLHPKNTMYLRGMVRRRPLLKKNPEIACKKELDMNWKYGELPEK